eukprot:COSAG04_NODE_6908_length_1231_cov_0.875442_2_plen_271_part_00
MRRALAPAPTTATTALSLSRFIFLFLFLFLILILFLSLTLDRHQAQCVYTCRLFFLVISIAPLRVADACILLLLLLLLRLLLGRSRCIASRHHRLRYSDRVKELKGESKGDKESQARAYALGGGKPGGYRGGGAHQAEAERAARRAEQRPAFDNKLYAPPPPASMHLSQSADLHFDGDFTDLPFGARICMLRQKSQHDASFDYGSNYIPVFHDARICMDAKNTCVWPAAGMTRARRRRTRRRCACRCPPAPLSIIQDAPSAYTGHPRGIY